MGLNIAPTLNALHRTISEPSAWRPFLQTLLSATGAKGGFVMALSPDATPAVYSDIDFTEQSQRSYREHFYQHDVILDRFRRAGERHGSWIGSRRSLLSDREMERSEFYHEYMRPLGHYHQVGANLGRVGEFPLAGVTLVRDREAGEFPAR